MGAWNVMSYGWPYITKEIPQYLITMTMDRVRGAKAAQTHNQTGKIKRDITNSLNGSHVVYLIQQNPHDLFFLLIML